MRKFALLSACSAVAFMSDFVETVTVKGEDGSPLRVNKSDYDADPTKWKLHKEEQPQAEPGAIVIPDQSTMVPLAAPSAPDFTTEPAASELPIDPLKNAAAPLTPSPNQRNVIEETVGRGAAKKQRFFIVDGAANKIDGDGIDPEGYETAQGAWTAIMALPH